MKNHKITYKGEKKIKKTIKKMNDEIKEIMDSAVGVDGYIHLEVGNISKLRKLIGKVEHSLVDIEMELGSILEILNKISYKTEKDRELVLDIIISIWNISTLLDDEVENANL